ncbi:acyl--CoA ligase [Pseudoalteromonas arctica]|uniref:Acyl--CoA ligase n=1 Tax=Pseudoalteromonas arctica TaxID=394751 RepID=A0AAP7CLD0_9GAMM|nr:class I adenylate-forming enzyme family protein [Pseudoalteromonas arctica]NMP03408.1 acyl--CoA ligase [Pseudoalteromonas arctica]
MSKGIYDRFADNVQHTPSKVAVVFMKQSLTYRELNQQVLKLESYFLKNGMREGQRVALFAPNGIEFVVALLAVAKLGFAVVPLPVSLKGQTLITALKKTPVTMVIAWPTISKVILKANIIASQNVITLGQKVADEPTWEDIQLSNEKYAIKSTIDLNAPFIITMTSGSTGQPKPIILSQACKINRAYNATINHYNLTSQDVILVATPMYHSLAQRGVLMPLMLGSTAIILPKFNLKHWLDAVETYRVSFLFAVSAQLESLVKYGVGDSNLDSLKCVVSSSAVLEELTKKKLLSLLPCRFHECYGASEVGVVTDFAVSEKPEQSGSVGQALSFVSLKIMDNKGRELAHNEIGEICCKTSTLFNGYLEMQAQTKNAFYLDGFFRTGDLGYIDTEAFLYFVGRKKEIISSGGINVFPQDIETVVKSIEGIAECVAFGVNDDTLGEVIKLIYEQSSEQSLEKDIRKVCLSELTDYQQPRFLERVLSLPRNAMGKVLRNDAKRQYS